MGRPKRKRARPSDSTAPEQGIASTPYVDTVHHHVSPQDGGNKHEHSLLEQPSIAQTSQRTSNQMKKTTSFYEDMMYGCETLPFHDDTDDHLHKGLPQQWLDSIRLYRNREILCIDHYNCNMKSERASGYNSTTITDESVADTDMRDPTSSMPSPLFQPDSVQESKHASIAKDINALRHQLQALKQELWPAAERCAQAWNYYYAQNDSQFTTSPKYEFEHARNMCNPFESLGSLSFDQVTRYISSQVKQGVAAPLSTSMKMSRCADDEQRKESTSYIDESIRAPHRRADAPFFVCRSASKLANIDCILNSTLTKKHGISSTVSRNMEKVDGESGICDSSFVFVDLCGAPGGFSEFLLHRLLSKTSTRGMESDYGDKVVPSPAPSYQGSTVSESYIQRPTCHGFGMSLIGQNEHGNGIDWQVDDILNSIKEYQKMVESAEGGMDQVNDSDHSQSYSICTGVDGTGDIYNWNNVMALQEEITKKLQSGKSSIEFNSVDITKKCDVKSTQDSTKISNTLVDLIVADGGFDAQRDAECQESLAHKIVTSQTAACFELLRQGGKFVIKMFGFRTVGSKIVLKALCDSFDEVHLLKPISSRPASAERYVVCIGYNGFHSSHDLLSWRDEVIKADLISRDYRSTCNQDLSMDTSLSYSLDLYDCQMLHLNKQALSAILQFLESQEETAREEGRRLRKLNCCVQFDTSLYVELWMTTS